MKNHYIPKFYLKRWAVKGHITEFERRRPGSPEITAMRRSPSATGYQVGLYDFSGLSPERQHHIEHMFFQMLDTKAADALALMENRKEDWKVELREAWAMFLVSLISRHPADIAAFKAVYFSELSQVSQAQQQEYERVREPHYPPSMEEYFATIGRELLGNLAMNSVPKLIMHERAVLGLMNMHWSVAVPPACGYFLTSDRPTIRTSLGQDDSHWMIPIGPRRLFVAAQKRSYGDHICEAVEGQGWKEVNRRIVRQAVSLGYADHDRYLPFFQKHLAAATSPSAFWNVLAEPKAAPPLGKIP